ncbi:MAG: C45 family autoproteolytic acyltransferase/hydrolase [Thermogutta sp.]
MAFVRERAKTTMSVRKLVVTSLLYCVIFVSSDAVFLEGDLGLKGLAIPLSPNCLAEEPANQSQPQTPWSFLRRAIDNIFASEDSFPISDPSFTEADSSALAPAYEEGSYGRGELRLINQIPVLILRGTPEEIGTQEAKLTAQATANLVAAPQDFLRQLDYPGGWEGLLARGRHLWQCIPKEYQRELVALAQSAGINCDELFAVNVLPDIYRSVACSSLIVLPERSATGKILFGRNLDFFSPRQLYRYSILKIYDCEGKRHRVASIGFPGFVGCLTAMNDAGLCLAVHEVHFTKDDSQMFNPDGVPYAMVMRQVMENCSTVEEAVAHLKKTPRTTLLNIALCDRKRAAVAEITPKNVVVREAEHGICACTNHFRTPELRVFVISPRHEHLLEAQNIPRIDVPTIKKKLHEVNLEFLTIQSVVFEPEDRVLHLAFGFPPVTKRPYQRVDLGPFFSNENKRSPQTVSSR